MTNKQIKIIAAIFFLAVVTLSLLISVKNSNFGSLPELPTKSVAFTGGIDNLNPLEKKIINELRLLMIPDSAIKSTFMIETEMKEINVLVPKGKPMEEIIQSIQGVTEKTSYSLDDSYYSSKSDRAKLHFVSSRKNEENIILHLRRARQGYFKQNSSMVLVISGLDTTSAEVRNRFLSYDGSLSYRINAWAPNIDTVSMILEKYGAPLVIEIPFESKSRTKPTLYTMKIDDSQSSIEEKLSDLMRKAPSISGISTESGDLFLETRNVTSYFFRSLRKRGLIFFDKRKGTFKRAVSIAYENKVPYYRQNKNLQGKSAEELSKELRRLCHTAGGRKQLILWGEASEALIDALETSGDYFEKTGVTLEGVNVLHN